MFVVLIGPAAAGKTTLARRLAKNDILINLDAATPSHADVDIRKWVRVEDIQEKYGLGINGALLKSMEIIAGMEEWIPEDAERIKFVDTPGQLEVFLYHDMGRKVVEKLVARDAVTSLFLVDATEMTEVENYLAMLAQNAMINLKLGVPSVTVINKIDAVDRERITRYFDMENLLKMLKGGDALVSLASGLVDYVEYTSIYQRPIMVSAKTGEGMDDLYSAIYEVHCSCGDLS